MVLPALEGGLLQRGPGGGDVHVASVVAGQRHLEDVLQHLALAVHQLRPHTVHGLQQQLAPCTGRTSVKSPDLEKKGGIKLPTRTGDGASPSLTSWLCVESASFSEDIMTCQVVILASASRPKPSTLLRRQRHTTAQNRPESYRSEGGAAGTCESMLWLPAAVQADEAVSQAGHKVLVVVARPEHQVAVDSQDA